MIASLYFIQGYLISIVYSFVLVAGVITFVLTHSMSDGNGTDLVMIK